MSDEKRKAEYLELLARLESFEELEVLLALLSDSEHSHATELATRTMMPEASVRDALGRLERSELVVTSAGGTHGIRRDRPQVESAIQELQAEYESNRLGVMTQMNANAIGRVRTAAMRAFARAFVLRSRNDG